MTGREADFSTRAVVAVLAAVGAHLAVGAVLLALPPATLGRWAQAIVVITRVAPPALPAPTPAPVVEQRPARVTAAAVRRAAAPAIGDALARAARPASLLRVLGTVGPPSGAIADVLGSGLSAPTDPPGGAGAALGGGGLGGIAALGRGGGGTVAAGGSGTGTRVGALDAQERSRLLSTIRGRIAAHRRYPELARRRGVEGTVTVAFRIVAGHPTAIEIRRGADPLLDEAAREAVLAAAPLPELAETVEVSLAFQLEDREAGW